MYLVDKQDVAGAEVCKKRGKIPCMRNCRTAGDAETDTHFVRDDSGKRRFAETGRTV